MFNFCIIKGRPLYALNFESNYDDAHTSIFMLLQIAKCPRNFRLDEAGIPRWYLEIMVMFAAQAMMALPYIMETLNFHDQPL